MPSQTTTGWLKTRIFEVLFLLVCLAFGLFLRLYHLDTDLLFHRDQGLHSLSIWRIWHDQDLTLLGHPSDVDGLFHSPVYYYLMLPAYFLSGGDPVAASVFQILFEFLTLPFFYLGIKHLFGKPTARLSILFYAVSYGLICYSRWLVNVTPILPFSHLLLYSLVFNFPLLAFFSAGIITQLNAAVGVFLFPFLVFFYIKKFKTIFAGTTLFLLPALPIVLFDFLHQHIISRSVLSFSGQSGAGIGLNPLVFINNLTTFFVEINHLLIYPFFFFSSILFLIALVAFRHHHQRRLIYGFLIIPFLGLSLYQRGAISFFFISLLPLSLALISALIIRLPRALSTILIVLIISLNLSHLPHIYQPSNALIPIGNANIITLQDRKDIVDWIYQQSHGLPFSVWFYTLPYFQEEVWDYTLLWYAAPKYGYLPEKTTGFSPNDLTTSRYFYAIWEPDADHPARLEAWHQQVLANFSTPSADFVSHDLFVEKHDVFR
ncbi:hypothetical protein A2368_03070 [Candidatus Collierbacteria bacterium RIFOXYB1_FULL_49_13]|uniref:Glycosyltransferase RgtA/B/C/D-like domain-containing protein n=1 Tax=Candidatus Collierbacteria bacterium RIFOXYB1_FULL_49_13 TaxID=1817728 RepID=A0A1F5FBD6_9BACT|nr:MAG: hypothetical protein A2368_03070 [Candidatus Collierbacteria bacterium RIFOXYB1_FULL_49_13]